MYPARRGCTCLGCPRADARDYESGAPVSICRWCERGTPQSPRYSLDDLDWSSASVLLAALNERLGFFDRLDIRVHARLVGWTPELRPGERLAETCVGVVSYRGDAEAWMVASYVTYLVDPVPHRDTRLGREMRCLFKALEELGVVLLCVTCRRPVHMARGKFHLGHNDFDPRRYWGVQHPRCNQKPQYLAVAARDPQPDTALTDIALGVASATGLDIAVVAKLMNIEITDEARHRPIVLRPRSYEQTIRIVIDAHRSARARHSY